MTGFTIGILTGLVFWLVLRIAYLRVVTRLIRRNIRALNVGDVEPLLQMFSREATLRFPGRSSWGCVHEGKSEISVFLERFVALGLTAEVESILVQGFPGTPRPPYNSTIEWTTSKATKFTATEPFCS